MKYGEMELAVNISGKDTFHKSTCCNTNAYKDLHECMYDFDMYVSVDGWHLWCISLAVVCVFFCGYFPPVSGNVIAPKLPGYILIFGM